jgi:hypothetical protein
MSRCRSGEIGTKLDLALEMEGFRLNKAQAEQSGDPLLAA